MAEEKEQPNPSMDDILSSIRDILSEDEKPAEALDVVDSDPGEEVDNTSVVEVAEEEIDTAVTADTTESEPQIALTEPEEEGGAIVALGSEPHTLDEVEPIREPVSAIPTSTPSVETDIFELTQEMIAQPPPNVGAGDSILSHGPSENSTDALQELAKALLSKRDIGIGNRDMTLEGLIREMLRPLLREWLDQNLPYLIERLVKKEIDHMVNRAERLEL
jgi:cell pole-organizing protein PopZ